MSTPTEPSWDLFGAFLAVMQTGSLSGASRALRVAQPTVRRQIEALEDALGGTLFTRAPNGLSPTELAQAALPHAEAIAASARALVRTASAPTSDRRGTVRVTASRVIGIEVLPAISIVPARRRIRLFCAGATMRTATSASRRSRSWLRSSSASSIWRSGASRRRRAKIGLFATAPYLEAHPAPKRTADLTAHAVIGPDRSRFALEGLAAAGIPLTARDFALRTDDDVAALAAVRAGLGIGICQVPLARAPVPLVRVLPSVRFQLDAWVVMHEDLRRVERVRHVADHLARELAGYAQPERSTKSRSSRPKGA